MRLQLLNDGLFVCPYCVRKQEEGGDITLQLIEEHRIVDGGDVKSGVLVCPACKFSFRIVEGVAIFTASQSSGKYEERETALGYVQTHYRDVISNDPALAEQLCAHDATGFYSGSPSNSYYLDVIELLGDRLTEESFVLDLGCSVGRLSRELAEKTKFVIGADPAFTQVKLAREILLTGKIKVHLGQHRVSGSGLSDHEVSISAGHTNHSNVEFIVADEGTLPFRQGRFDAICASAVIDRVQNADVFLANLQSISRDGMTLLITSPFDWEERTTPRGNWLGFKGFGTREGTSEAALKELARKRRYRLISEREIPWITFSDRRHHSVWCVYSGVFEHWSYEIQRLDAKEDPSQSFIETYRRVWAESEIYQEDFSGREIRDATSEIGLLLLAGRRLGGGVVGFAGGTRLDEKNETHRRARETLFAALADEYIFFIDELGVLREFEGAGMGAELLERLLSHARAEGHFIHTLMTSYDNRRAISLYKRHGFSPLYDSDGLVMKAVTKRRKGGEERTDFRPYLYRVDEFKKVRLSNGREMIIVFIHPGTMKRDHLYPFAAQISKLFGRAFWHSDEPGKGWALPSIMRRLPDMALAILAFEATSREPVGYALFDHMKCEGRSILLVSSEGVSGVGPDGAGGWQGGGLGIEMLKEALRRLPSDALVARTQNGGIARMLRKLRPGRIYPLDATYSGDSAALLQAVEEGAAELRRSEIEPSTGISKGVYREGKLGDYEECVNPEYIREFEERMLELDPSWNRGRGDAVVLIAEDIPTPL